jgi:hypothetical protein
MENLLGEIEKLPLHEFAKSDVALIQGYKQRIPKLMAEADWQSHPVTLDLKQEAQKRVKDIRDKLADEELSLEKQARLRGERDAHQFYIDAMSKNPESELKTIEDDVRQGQKSY